MKCGDVVLLSYPFTDDTAAKLRPALVVSADRFNQGEDVIVVPISSSPRGEDPFAHQINESDQYFRGTGLRRTSHVKWTKVLAISEKLAQRRLGHLHADDLGKIRASIRTLFE